MLKQKILLILKIGLWITCLGLCFWRVLDCTRSFLEDKSNSNVKYVKFLSSPEAEYPTISLCIINPYLEEEISKYGTNYSAYSAAIHGEGQLASSFMFYDIPYENITLNAENRYLSFESRMFDREIGDVSKDEGSILEITSNPLLNSASYKCYTAIVKISRNPWMWGISMSVKNVTKKRIPLRVMMNLPGSFRGGKYETLFKTFVGNPTSLNHEIDTMDITERRSTRNSPCYEDSAGYDEHVVTQALEEANCKPPYINMEKFNHLANCTVEKLKYLSLDFMFSPKGLDKLIKPCKETVFFIAEATQSCRF